MVELVTAGPEDNFYYLFPDKMIHTQTLLEADETVNSRIVTITENFLKIFQSDLRIVFFESGWKIYDFYQNQLRNLLSHGIGEKYCRSYKLKALKEVSHEDNELFEVLLKLQHLERIEQSMPDISLGLQNMSSCYYYHNKCYHLETGEEIDNLDLKIRIKMNQEYFLPTLYMIIYQGNNWAILRKDQAKLVLLESNCLWSGKFEVFFFSPINIKAIKPGIDYQHLPSSLSISCL